MLELKFYDPAKGQNVTPTEQAGVEAVLNSPFFPQAFDLMMEAQRKLEEEALAQAEPQPAVVTELDMDLTEAQANEASVNETTSPATGGFGNFFS